MSGGPVSLVKPADPFDLRLDERRGALGERHVAVLPALPVTHQDLAQLEVHVLHPEREALFEPQAGRVEGNTDHEMLSSELLEHEKDLAVGEYRRHPLRPLRPRNVRETGLDRAPPGRGRPRPRRPGSSSRRPAGLVPPDAQESLERRSRRGPGGGTPLVPGTQEAAAPGRRKPARFLGSGHGRGSLGGAARGGTRDPFRRPPPFPPRPHGPKRAPPTRRPGLSRPRPRQAPRVGGRTSASVSRGCPSPPEATSTASSGPTGDRESPSPRRGPPR